MLNFVCSKITNMTNNMACRKQIDIGNYISTIKNGCLPF